MQKLLGIICIKNYLSKVIISTEKKINNKKNTKHTLTNFQLQYFDKYHIDAEVCLLNFLDHIHQLLCKVLHGTETVL